MTPILFLTMLCSSSVTFTSDDHLSNHGNSDILVIKLDSLWNIEWYRMFGGSDVEEGKSIIQDRNENYVIAGIYASKDQDFNISRGIEDMCVLKINRYGQLIWIKTFGGSSTDKLWNIINTYDGDYVCTGYTWSPDFFPDKFVGGGDWVTFKLDTSGRMIWSNYFGTPGRDYSSDVIQLTDSSIMITGYIRYDNHFENPHDTNIFPNNADAMLMKLDKNGKEIWRQVYAGDWTDYISALNELDDRGFLVGGSTSSSEFKVSTPRELDAWLMRLDKDGNMLWSRTFGGKDVDRIEAILPLSGKDFLIMGTTSSGLGGMAKCLGSGDYFAMKADLNGLVKWVKTYGSPNRDQLKTAVKINENCYLMGGTSYSDSTKNDFLLIAIDSTGTEVRRKLIGGIDEDNFESIVHTKDKGYILAGTTWSKDLKNLK